MDRQRQRLSGEIPDREVDGCLGVVMARQMLVHSIPDPVGHAGSRPSTPVAISSIPARTPRAGAERNVGGAEGRALAPALQPGIGAQPDKGRIEAVVVPTMGQVDRCRRRRAMVQLEDIEEVIFIARRPL